MLTCDPKLKHAGWKAHPNGKGTALSVETRLIGGRHKDVQHDWLTLYMVCIPECTKRSLQQCRNESCSAGVRQRAIARPSWRSQVVVNDDARAGFMRMLSAAKSATHNFWSEPRHSLGRTRPTSGRARPEFGQHRRAEPNRTELAPWCFEAAWDPTEALQHLAERTPGCRSRAIVGRGESGGAIAGYGTQVPSASRCFRVGRWGTRPPPPDSQAAGLRGHVCASRVRFRGWARCPGPRGIAPADGEHMLPVRVLPRVRRSGWPSVTGAVSVCTRSWRRPAPFDRAGCASLGDLVCRLLFACRCFAKLYHCGSGRSPGRCERREKTSLSHRRRAHSRLRIRGSLHISDAVAVHIRAHARRGCRRR